jgi:hypothetical protein
MDAVKMNEWFGFVLKHDRTVGKFGFTGRLAVVAPIISLD